MADNFEQLEQDVLGALVEGDDPVLHILRSQLQVATRTSREMTGAGFFSNFDMPAPGRRLPGNPSFALSDVWADIEGLEYVAGFILFVDKGVLTMLEGSSCEGVWPAAITTYTVYYTNKKKRDFAALRAMPGWPKY